MHWDFTATRSTVTALAGSTLVEEVLVHALDHARLLVLDSDVVADHQPTQCQAVEQDDPGRHSVYTVESQRILADHAVEALVSRLPSPGAMRARRATWAVLLRGEVIDRCAEDPHHRENSE